MRIQSVSVVMVAIVLLALSACTTPVSKSAAADSRCGTKPVPFTRDTEVLEIFRVNSGADGLSYGQIEKIQGNTTTYLGAVLRQFELGNPSNAVIVSGPPDFQLPEHAAPYREIFMVLSGSVTATLSGGQSFAMQPGSLILFEDTTGKGHGGKVGPCGYVSLDLQFKPS